MVERFDHEGGEVLKVPREKVCYRSMSLYHIIKYSCHHHVLSNNKS